METARPCQNRAEGPCGCQGSVKMSNHWLGRNVHMLKRPLQISPAATSLTYRYYANQFFMTLSYSIDAMTELSTPNKTTEISDIASDKIGWDFIKSAHL